MYCTVYCITIMLTPHFSSLPPPTHPTIDCTVAVHSKVRELVTNLGCWTYYAGGMRYLVRGKQAPRHEAPILVIAPHSTFFDAGICYVTGLPSIIVRRESGLHPFMGSTSIASFYWWRDSRDTFNILMQNYSI